MSDGQFSAANSPLPPYLSTERFNHAFENFPDASIFVMDHAYLDPNLITYFCTKLSPPQTELRSKLRQFFVYNSSQGRVL